MTISISSYIKEGDRFYRIEEFMGAISDSDYIEGAISISVDGAELLGLDYCDYVDQLWLYIVDGIREIAADKDFSTYFPDQPVKLSFTNVNKDSVLLEIHDDEARKVLVDKAYLISSFKKSCATFFKKLKILDPVNKKRYDNIILSIDAIS